MMQKKYRFFFNPYAGMAFTQCPNCGILSQKRFSIP